MNWMALWWSKLLFDLIVAGGIIVLCALIGIIVLLRIRWVDRQRAHGKIYKSEVE